MTDPTTSPEALTTSQAPEQASPPHGCQGAVFLAETPLEAAVHAIRGGRTPCWGACWPDWLRRRLRTKWRGQTIWRRSGKPYPKKNPFFRKRLHG